MSLITQTITYLSSGTRVIEIPAGVSAVEMHLWGGGGASGAVGGQTSREIGQQIIGQRQVGTKVVGQEVVGQRVAGQVATGQIQTGVTESQVQTGTRTVQVQSGTRTEQQIDRYDYVPTLTGYRTERRFVRTDYVRTQTGTRLVQQVGATGLPSTTTWTRSSGSGQFQVPPGVTRLSVDAKGAGGGGGGGHGLNGAGCGNESHKGGKGGNGEGKLADLTVTPGQQISWSVGVGGTGGGGNTNGTAGTATSFGSVTALAGGGGIRGTGDGAGKAGTPTYTGGATGGVGGVWKGGSGGAGGSGSITLTYGVFVEEPVYENLPVDVYENVQVPVYENVKTPVYKTVTLPVFSNVEVPVYETQFTPVYTIQFTVIYEDVFAPLYGPAYEDIYGPVFETIGGGPGGRGGGGGYVKKVINVSEGDILRIVVGASGQQYLGGDSYVDPTGLDYRGGDAGASNEGGRGGGGGGATVVLLNDTVIAVAAGGGGGGGGGTDRTSGADGTAALNSGVGSGNEGRGQNSGVAIASGGGGGGGAWGGRAGGGGATGQGGQGGTNLGPISESGTGTAPGGRSSTYYPGKNLGFADYSGAAVLVFVRSFNIFTKRSNLWKTIDNIFLKVENQWKPVLNGWVKVAGSWEPLIATQEFTGTEISYGLTSNVAVIDEGQAVTFTLTATGIETGTAVPYTVTGIQSADLATGSAPMAGTFQWGVSGGNERTFVIAEDKQTEGPQTMTVVLNTTTVRASCTITDTSTTPTYSLTRSAAAINEGESVTFTLVTGGAVDPGEEIQWSMTGIPAGDLTAGTTTGKFIVGSSDTATFTLRNNRVTNGVRTLTLSLYGKNVSSSCTINDTSTDPTFAISAPTAVNEGATVVFTLVTNEVDNGTVVPYVITGITAADLSAGSLTGSFVVGSVDSVSVTLANDSLTEGTERMVMTLTGKNVSHTVTVYDTSTTVLVPSYSLSANVASVNEGRAVEFTLSTTNVSSGSVVPYAISGIGPGDLSQGSLTGNFVVGSANRIVFVLRNDAATEGAETMTMSLPGVSGVNASVTVNDTSQDPLSAVYNLTSDKNSINEGEKVTFSISPSNIDYGTSIPFTLTGINKSRIFGGATTGVFIVGIAESYEVTVLANRITDGNGTLTLTINGTNTSKSVTVVDSSTSPTYTLSADAASVNENGTVVFTLTSNAPAGESIQYSVTGITANDLISGSLTGTFTTISDIQKTFVLKEDFVTEGNETMTMSLFGKGASASVTVVDSSPQASGSVQFTSGSGSWTVPAGVSKIKAILVGGGAGGGRGSEQNPYVSGGGGGGGGGNFVQTISVTPGQTFNYAVGTGGAGLPSGGTNGGAGGAGGSTTFGTLTATGGQPPTSNQSTSHKNIGGLGGTPNGSPGENGQIIDSDNGGPTVGGRGGNTPYGTGGNGAAAVTGQKGADGTGYGAGGGGGAGRGGSGTPTQGGSGSGTGGYIKVEWGPSVG